MIFKYDPGQAAAQLTRDGYAHLPDVISAEFLAYLRAFYETGNVEPRHENVAWRVVGKKRQMLFEFPSQVAAEEFRGGIARLTGISSARLTISERHLKIYDAEAAAWPTPHKDRSASTISIGLPVQLSMGSSVCIFPDLDPGRNLNERALFLGEVRPEIVDVYATARTVMLHEEVGDIVAFMGSALFHERVRPAGSAVLYIKVNGDGADPLCENISVNARGV